MAGVKAANTPMTTTTSLSLYDKSTSVDDEEYRRVIGSLKYLLLTRPDISFAVNKLAQYMHKPTRLHLVVLKRVLRYLKGIIDRGIRIPKLNEQKLVVYTDSYWAGDRDDRTSTTTYVIYLGNMSISWSSRKQKTIARSST